MIEHHAHGQAYGGLANRYEHESEIVLKPFHFGARLPILLSLVNERATVFICETVLLLLLPSLHSICIDGRARKDNELIKGEMITAFSVRFTPTRLSMQTSNV